ncbi:MAG: tRNA (guanosine(46)-N7)-methyltransferase TrmB [Deltaproteobacteria bacterium]|nr:tRNA (guanosine(46)-N7)-methyltransferase TrmB [Deltaproteobacteria bacterium]
MPQKNDFQEIEKPNVIYPAGLVHTFFHHEKSKPLIVEIGPGRGDLLFHLANEHPEAIVVGIELKSKRVDKMIARIEKLELTNVILLQADAKTALDELKDQPIKEWHIHFSDPWPKRRHAPRRLLSLPFLENCSALLQPKGKISITTDVEWYAHDVAKIIDRIPQLSSCSPEKVQTSSDDAFPTYFAEKWKKAGRNIYYLRYWKS